MIHFENARAALLLRIELQHELSVETLEKPVLPDLQRKQSR